MHLLSSDFHAIASSSSDLLHLICFSFIDFSTLHIVGSLLFKLPSTTPVVQSTTKYLKKSAVLQRLLEIYSVLQSTTTQSTTPYYKVLLCTTKRYSSTTLYYKVLLQYYNASHHLPCYHKKAAMTKHCKAFFKQQTVIQQKGWSENDTLPSWE